jgi:hypothetical protein
MHGQFSLHIITFALFHMLSSYLHKDSMKEDSELTKIVVNARLAATISCSSSNYVLASEGSRFVSLPHRRPNISISAGFLLAALVCARPQMGNQAPLLAEVITNCLFSCPSAKPPLLWMIKTNYDVRQKSTLVQV